ncbi:MAG TPA: DUF167 domain-containing protein [Alphaproteobacteria bacterium]|nr:DUF167 domain-containing protein [Alphaproteobacteria bacterium]
MGSPFAEMADGVRILVRVSPRSAPARVLGLADRPDGRAELRIALASPPEGGRANAELIAFLARQWRVPKRSLSLLSGAVDRHKTLHLAGESGRLRQHLEAWLAARLAGASRR